MPAAMPAAPAGGAAAPVEEEKPAEKTEFKVKLDKIDPAAKAKVIREVKNLTGMNLVEVIKSSNAVCFDTLKRGIWFNIVYVYLGQEVR